MYSTVLYGLLFFELLRMLLEYELLTVKEVSSEIFEVDFVVCSAISFLFLIYPLPISVKKQLESL